MIRRFNAVGDNLFLISNKLIENQDVCKLLYYTTKTPLSEPSLTEDQRVGLLNKNILIVPEVPENDNVKGSYIIVLYDNFVINGRNSEFKEAEILFLVVCPPEDWIVNEGSLRPFLIMNQIDEMFNGQKLADIGTLHFMQAERFVLTPQLTGYAMTYSTYEFN